MLLTITTTHRPATDLGYLLFKHPSRCQAFDLGFGQAHICYPEASEERCTAALVLDIDPVALVRGRRGARGDGGLLSQYVNDRPYAASSFLSVAMAQVFRSAMRGAPGERPHLAAAALPLEASLPALACRGGEGFLRSLFEPLGYRVEARPVPLDERFPEWGPGPYFAVTLAAEQRVRDLLSHLYVLLPVLDDEKHYWVGEAELEKLLRHGEDWLSSHPAKEEIARRYLKRRGHLVREAMARLMADEETDPDERDAGRAAEEQLLERPISLQARRIATVVAELKELGARSVLDLGCGEGRLLQPLLSDRRFERIAGMDVSFRALAAAARRLGLERLPPAQRDRITLFQGALTYRDRRLAGYDAACAVEVIEHLEPLRLPVFEWILFQDARPHAVLVTTPNAEYNPRFGSLPAGRMRHRDHRFEWTRAEFRAWAEGICERHGYAARFAAIGEDDPEVGPPTQMAVFTR